MSNRILNSVNILYTPNIDDVKRYNKYASPNTFVVSSYYNSGTYIGFDYYKGLSYELYYIDDNNNINQLTYNLVPGNGLNIKDNKFEINIDNKTLISNNGYIYANVNNFKGASYLNSGILYVDHDLYYNDNCKDISNNNGAFTVKNNTITLSNGLLHDLNLIKDYYYKCNTLISDIDKLYKECIDGLNASTTVNVGDILYYNYSKKIYTLNKTNKNGSNNTPAMICVIASNVLPDMEPRFMPLKRNNEQYVFDTSNNISVLNALKSLPIYSTNDLTKINVNTSISEASEGFIAIKRNDWSSYTKNPLNTTENYYVKNNTSIINKFVYIDFLPLLDTIIYVDASKIDYNNNYIISTNGVYTTNIPANYIKKIKSKSLYVIITLTFNNGLSKNYACNLTLVNNRFVNKSKVYGYNLLTTITNSFNESSTGISEKYYYVNKGTIKEYSTSTLEITTNINFQTLKTIDTSYQVSVHVTNPVSNQTTYTTYTNTYISADTTYIYKDPLMPNPSKYDDNTFVISNKIELVTDTEVKIINFHTSENKYIFNIIASANGTVSISTSSCSINKKTLYIQANVESEYITLTNNNNFTEHTHINVIFNPSDLSKYKTSSTSMWAYVPFKEKEVNNTIENAFNNVNTNDNTNSSDNTKKPSGGTIILDDNKQYDLDYAGGFIEISTNKGS